MINNITRGTVIYSVTKIKDITTPVKYPLLTQKKSDFLLFSSVVDLMNKKRTSFS
jgi:hypothetical protein